MILGPLAGDRAAVLALAVAGGLFIAFFNNLMHVLENYVNTKLNLSMGLDFRSDLFRHSQRLSMAFHDRRRSGMLIYQISYQCDAASGLIMAVPPLATNALTLFGMFAVIYLIDPKLALLSVSIVPLLYYSTRYYVKHIQPQIVRVKGFEAETLSVIHEAISMIRVIAAFGREDHEYRRYRAQGTQAVDERVRLTVRQTLFSLAVNMTTACGTALVLGYGAYHALKGRLTVGELLVILSYVAAVYKPLEAISQTVGSLQDQIVSLRLTLELLDTIPEVSDPPGARVSGRALGQVAFEGVQFRYADRVDTLKEIDFEVVPGQRVALVGPTGAGKTTLISLILRFYDPTHGRILLDGEDIRSLTLESLRKQVSLVLQEPLLFSDTIANNIRYGRLDATMDEIIDAAKAANAHQFICKLPDGYDTVVGERGAKLSGGERQRISVARAFLKNAPILLLDEPTSSIDSRTEAVILDALDRLMEGRTTFLVAHRLSTIRSVDTILVMDQGRVVGQGSHESLLHTCPLYRQLYELQSAPQRQPA